MQSYVQATKYTLHPDSSVSSEWTKAGEKLWEGYEWSDKTYQVHSWNSCAPRPPSVITSCNPQSHPHESDPWIGYRAGKHYGTSVKVWVETVRLGKCKKKGGSLNFTGTLVHALAGLKERAYSSTPSSFCPCCCPTSHYVVSVPWPRFIIPLLASSAFSLFEVFFSSTCTSQKLSIGFPSCTQA